MNIKYELAPLIICETASLILLVKSIASKSVKIWGIAFILFIAGLLGCTVVRYLRLKIGERKWKK